MSPAEREQAAADGAATVQKAFESYRQAFDEVTRRARRRFESRDWRRGHADSAERLDLYRLGVDAAVSSLGLRLGPQHRDRPTWALLKQRYSGGVAARADRELAETFLNSVTRRVFSTVGVDPSVEFVDTDFDLPAGAGADLSQRFHGRAGTRELVAEVLRCLPFHLPFPSLERDAAAGAARLDAAAAELEAGAALELEVAKSVFYRGKGAYLVGLLSRGGERSRPVVLALVHEDAGLRLDALLADEDSVSIVFGYTRAYFSVEAERPAALVAFLERLLPRKKRAELYIALGFDKHGKTELYRDLRKHLRGAQDRFEIARGERGLVMLVFTLPSYDLVFKVIRDRFAEPKTTTRERVMERYGLVFRHDRAGRLIDAQEFEHLAFERKRFSESLLEELLADAAGSVSVAGETVSIRHLYTERRLEPLNLVLRESGAGAALAAVLDYGQAIRDLAATNVFPGDVLLKNFGLTRHGRVVFYDYDELALVTECHFREMPAARHLDEEMEALPWFYVAPNDIFPEEFVRFLGLPPVLLERFLAAHGQLLTAAFWRTLQARLRDGEIVDIFPYRQDQRLPG